MEKFTSQQELFNKVLPAIRTRKHELARKGINYVKEIDIWNYNKNNNWKNKTGLTLASIVDDILNTDDTAYKDYVLKKLEEYR